MRNDRRFFAVVALLGAVTVVVAGAALSAPTFADEPMAVVDGEVIDAAALHRSVRPLGPRGEALLVNPGRRRDQLEQLIDARLLAKEGQAQGLAEAPDFQALVRETTARLLAERYLEHYVETKATPAAAKALFDADPAAYSAKELRASHLLFADEATARKALALAKAPNADWSNIRAQYPAPAGIAPNQAGGDLGWFRRGGMAPEFEAAAFATKVGTVHPKVVQTPFGWHVLKVTGERGDDKVRFADVAAKVTNDLREKLRQEAIAQVRAKAKIVVNETALRNFR